MGRGLRFSFGQSIVIKTFMKTHFVTNYTPHRIARIILWLVILVSAHTVFSQSVTILPGGIIPNQSGAIPRLSYESIMALSNPQDGDEAYDVTFHCKRLYSKNKWVRILSGTDLANPSTLGWQMGGTKYDWGNGLATDASGNVYVGGYFEGSATFENTTVTGNGVDFLTLFIAKYTSDGHLLWVQKIAYVSSAYMYDLVLDSNGNIYVTGYFHNSITFGANTLTATGNKDIFIAKYSNNGTLQWVQQAGGTGDDEGKGLGLDSDGNLYITGTIFGNVTFGGKTYLSSGHSVFTVKFDSNGAIQWLRRGICTNSITSNSMVVDTDGKVTVIGTFLGNVTFGFDTYTSAGAPDVFLVQYDSDGNLIWVKRMGGTGIEYGMDIALDTENNIIITGSFQATAGFDNLNLTSAGGSDIFLVKFSSAGLLKWVKRDGGVDDEHGKVIAIDASDNLLIAGEFTGAFTLEGTPLYGKANANIFVAKYNKNMEFQWVKEMGGAGQELPFEIVADTKGNVYSMGFFANGFISDDTNFTSRGGYDIFVVRLRD